MLGIPARLAGCRTRLLCSPPGPNGSVDPAVLYAAEVAGVERVFRIGGAQAIAALAYGTESIPRVDKVFGPGNAWVTEAKAQVDRDPAGAARDFPAGPSEVLVIADASADPAFVATDLLSQAEHGPDSQVLLITTVPSLAAAVIDAINTFSATLPRRAIIEQALEHSRIIVVDSVIEAMDISNRYAPEHLLLQVTEPRALLAKVAAAGSVFLGPWSPESIGDYCSGTNHVLPTYGYARRNSSLGLGDFMRSMTVQELSPAGLSALGPVAETLARLEQLDAHALAVSARLQRLSQGTHS
jgi:histidinol dehydrogenase